MTIAAQGSGYGVMRAGRFLTSIPFATYSAAKDYLEALIDAEFCCIKES
jgi:hypothetical protein